MRVIGVGFGRTGTASLQAALDRLGVGPCYHMRDVVREPARARDWLAAAQGERPAWDRIFAGYRSTVDWPGAAFWRELVAAYPQAQTILTVRDPQRWYDSMDRTILAAWRQRAAQPDAGGGDHARMTDLVVGQRVFGGRADDRAHAVATFERHTAEVRAALPADRLLVFEVAQGWPPLCDFLGVPVPDESFPRLNDTAEFRQRADVRSA